MTKKIFELPAAGYDAYETKTTLAFTEVVNMLIGYTSIFGEDENAHSLVRVRDIVRSALSTSIKTRKLIPENLVELEGFLEESKNGNNPIHELTVLRLAEFKWETILEWLDSGQILEKLQRHGHKLPEELVPMLDRIKARMRLFQKAGDYWEIGYDGKSFLLEDSKGLGYIAYLLNRPGKRIPSLDLYHALRGAPDKLTLEAVSHPEYNEEILDDESRMNYKKALSVLNEKLEEAETLDDPTEKEDLEHEIFRIEKYLKQATKPSGKSRKFKSSNPEKVRQAVKKGITTAIKIIQKYSPSLVQHLEAIETGKTCIYKPYPSDITWNN